MSTYNYPSIDAFLRRKRSGVGQINSRTGAISRSLQPFAGSAGRIFGEAQGAESSLGGALSGALATSGQAVGADISTKLGAIQAPTQAVDEYGTGTATTGQQAGAAVGALSSAELERLRSSGTAEEIFASALPRLAQLAGEAERRSFMGKAAEELADLSAREAEQQYRRMIDERKWQYDLRQDAMDQKRQAKLDRIERSRYRTKLRRDLRADEAQALRDALAAKAAAWLDKERLDVSRGHLSERERHNLRLEQQAAAREERMREQGAKGGDKKTAYFDVAREDAFRRAQKYAESQKAALARNRIDRATARTRLWAEFGTLLLGRGYPRRAVEQMLQRALAAAGY